MDPKTRDLALLAALSLFCAGVAWIFGHLVLGSVLFAQRNLSAACHRAARCPSLFRCAGGWN
jgi:hypothetical protein